MQVISVGRKWIVLDDFCGRVDKTQDNGTKPATTHYTVGYGNNVYRDEQHYTWWSQLRKLRQAVVDRITSNQITDTEVLQIAQILGDGV